MVLQKVVFWPLGGYCAVTLGVKAAMILYLSALN